MLYCAHSVTQGADILKGKTMSKSSIVVFITDNGIDLIQPHVKQDTRAHLKYLRENSSGVKAKHFPSWHKAENFADNYGADSFADSYESA